MVYKNLTASVNENNMVFFHDMVDAGMVEGFTDLTRTILTRLENDKNLQLMWFGKSI